MDFRGLSVSVTERSYTVILFYFIFLVYLKLQSFFVGGFMVFYGQPVWVTWWKYTVIWAYLKVLKLYLFCRRFYGLSVSVTPLWRS